MSKEDHDWSMLDCPVSNKSDCRQPNVHVAAYLHTTLFNGLEAAREIMMGDAYDTLTQDLKNSVPGFNSKLLVWSWNELTSSGVPDLDYHLDYDGERMLSVHYFQELESTQTTIGWKVVNRKAYHELVK